MIPFLGILDYIFTFGLIVITSWMWRMIITLNTMLVYLCLARKYLILVAVICCLIYSLVIIKYKSFGYTLPKYGYHVLEEEINHLLVFCWNLLTGLPDFWICLHNYYYYYYYSDLLSTDNFSWLGCWNFSIFLCIFYQVDLFI